MEKQIFFSSMYAFVYLSFHLKTVRNLKYYKRISRRKEGLLYWTALLHKKMEIIAHFYKKFTAVIFQLKVYDQYVLYYIICHQIKNKSFQKAYRY